MEKSEILEVEVGNEPISSKYVHLKYIQSLNFEAKVESKIYEISRFPWLVD